MDAAPQPDGDAALLDLAPAAEALLLVRGGEGGVEAAEAVGALVGLDGVGEGGVGGGGHCVLFDGFGGVVGREGGWWVRGCGCYLSSEGSGLVCGSWGVGWIWWGVGLMGMGDGGVWIWIWGWVSFVGFGGWLSMDVWVCGSACGGFTGGLRRCGVLRGVSGQHYWL